MTSDAGSPADFEVAVTFTEHVAVVGAIGELDSRTAPEFGAVLGAVIERGHGRIVVDLAKLQFMGAAGLGVIASASGRMRASGGTLAVRSPSVLVTRLLGITGLDERIRIEVADSEVPAPAQDPSLVPSHPPVDLEPDRLMRQLRDVVAIPAAHDVVDGVLRLVVVLAQATVGGADGASVSLRRHGRLATVASSNETVAAMDAQQYAAGEGPCVDASIEGFPFHMANVAEETRWPDFTPKARELGIEAILSSPLLADGESVGALNIYSGTAGAFSGDEKRVASIFAAEASALLSGVGVGAADELLSARLGTALGTRQLIAEALGMTMDREGISEEAAFAVLRARSLSIGRPLREVALAVVASAGNRLPEPLRTGEPDGT